MKPLPFLLAAALLASAPVLAMDRPPKPEKSQVDDEHCTWEWKEGAGLGVWTEKCRLDTGLWEVAFDDKLQAFTLSADGEDPMVVLQPFAKAKDADVSAVLPDLIKRGLVPATECQFAPADTSYIPKPPPGQTFYEIVPTGERLKAYKALPDDEVPEPPCGDYGMAPDGIQYFMVDAAHPEKVIFVNLGQDGTMFDPKTITME